MPARTRRLVGLLALGGVLAGASMGTAGNGTRRDLPTRSLADALARPGGSLALASTERQPVPEDRYALAGGCYAARSLATGRYLARSGSTFAATGTAKSGAAPFHFQAYDLGKYLVSGTGKDFLAAQSKALPQGVRPVTGTADGYVKGTGDETLNPARTPVLGATAAATSAADLLLSPLNTAGTGVVAAAKPSADAEWVVRQAGANAFTLHLPVDDHEEANPGPLDPAVAGTLTATTGGALAVARGTDTSQAARFAFEVTTGCAEWPEVELNVTGGHAAGTTPYEETTGFVDAHLHMMAFEFIGGESRCGRPWHPYGVTYALVDCDDHEPGGNGAVLEQVLSGGTPGEGHDTVGWPTFGYWPKYKSLTHEQVYYRWLERAWRGGLRMFTNLLVDNGVLCEIYPYKRNSCNEMDGVRLQAQRLHELERYVDAQSGGPGEGWFRIVKDPFEARRVVNAGKLAVVMGIEVSVPLDCGERLGNPRCTTEQIDQRLDEVYALGVRQMELTNKFDNALTGVTGDDGVQSVVNAGNAYETGHFWKMQTCVEPHDHTTHRHDKLQPNVADGYDGTAPPAPVGGRDSIFGGVLQVFGPTGAAPAYPPGPHCNVVGLSELGRHAIDGLAARGMVFDPDHMSAKAREQALAHFAAQGYSGIVSSHSWSDDPTYQAILRLGGVVTPHAGGSASFVEKWRKVKGWADPRFTFGINFGSDMNGFSTQGSPRNPGEAADVDYPFTGLGGAVFGKQVSGQQTYDVNTDGIDHYGLYPDWVEDVRIAAGADGDAFVADLARGAESYLQMWERAVGIRPSSCRTDVSDLSNADLRAVKKGMTPEQVMVALGQPEDRTGSAFRYCGTGGAVTVTFGADGRVAKVAKP
jgi:hypothetical protein